MKRLILRCCALAALALTIQLLAAGPAHAADAVYVQYACHFPDGRPASVDGFTASATGAAVTANHCGEGGGLGISLPEGDVPASTTVGSWTYEAATGTSIAAVTLTRLAQNISSPDADGNRFFYLRGGPDSSLTDSCGLQSPCPASRDLEIPTARTSFVVASSCATSPCHGPVPGASLVSIDRISITLRDDQPPTLNAQPTGTLFDDEAASGMRSVIVAANDVGGGVFTAALVVDGVEREAHVVDGNDGACSKPFTAAVPCKSSVLGRFDVDTTQFSDGEHSVSVVVRDATEVNSTMSPAVLVRVANRAGITASSPNSSAAIDGSVGGRALKIAGRDFKRGEIRQRFGRTSDLHGRLLTEAGQPAADQPLEIFAAPTTPDAALTRIGVSRSDGAGRFRVVLPAGPSRRIVVRSGSGSWALRLTVSAPLRLAPSRSQLRNKQKLMLVAYLLGAKAPAGSADVAFQVRIGHQWRTFATRPITKEGRARIGHRFRVTYQSLTYRFRAIIVGRRTFPFANSVSPPVSVRVN
ncbi:MAG: hypothetical protein ACJ762_03145 [Solirubrobacteraceae bacterium]